jgi:hypothetical protein
MIVLKFTRPDNGLIHDPIYHLGLESYSDVGRKCYLFLADFYDSLRLKEYRDRERVALTFEEPNFCHAGTSHSELNTAVDRVLTLCPYTAACFSNSTSVFFPTYWAETHASLGSELKDIDVVYFGSKPTAVRWDLYISNVLSKYKFVWGSYSEGNVRNFTYQQKMALYRRSKVSIVHGLCNVNKADLAKYRQYPFANENIAFQKLDLGFLPQIKSRMFEAAFSKSLILCQKDFFNPIEFYFTENEHFIYFNDEHDLARKISHILLNYNEFEPIINSAFLKATTSYTTRHFVEKYLVD